MESAPVGRPTRKSEGAFARGSSQALGQEHQIRNRTRMTRFLVVLAISLLGPTGCAVNPRGPEVESICIDVPQETSQEVAYVRRRVAEFFQESGFSLSEGECDVLVEYAVFGAFQGELFERRVSAPPTAVFRQSP
jgi:hypothetical protein